MIPPWNPKITLGASRWPSELPRTCFGGDFLWTCFLHQHRCKKLSFLERSAKLKHSKSADLSRASSVLNFSCFRNQIRKQLNSSQNNSIQTNWKSNQVKTNPPTSPSVERVKRQLQKKTNQKATPINLEQLNSNQVNSNQFISPVSKSWRSEVL